MIKGKTYCLNAEATWSLRSQVWWRGTSWLMLPSLGLGKRPMDPEPRSVKARCCLDHTSYSEMGHIDISKLFNIMQHWDPITFGKKKITIFLFLTLLFASLILQISYKIPAGNFTGYLMFLLVSSFYSYVCIFNQLHVYTFNKINIQLNIGRWDKMMS